MTSSHPSGSYPDLARPWYTQAIAQTLSLLGSDAKQGLSSQEVHQRQQYYGFNEIQETTGRSGWVIFLDQFKNIMLVMLIAVALISGILDLVEMQAGEAGDGIPFKDTIAILSIVILNGILGYLQESRAEKALSALKRLSAPRVRVLRDGQILEVDAPALVPGDIMLLEAGAQVSADGRLVFASNLQVREAALTGEAAATEKRPELELPEDTPLGDRANMVFMGTEVVQGRGKVIVTGTGMHTELGKIAQMLQSVKSEPTPLQRRMAQLGEVLVSGALILVALVVVGGVIAEGWSRLPDLIEVSLSMAVAVVPEGLPAVITVTLALGTQRMVRRQALIRRLPAVETLGSVNTICSDKTGTLTQNKMVVQEVATMGKWFHVTGEGYIPRGEFRLSDDYPIAPKDYPELQVLLIAGVLCNDATLQFVREELPPVSRGETPYAPPQPAPQDAWARERTVMTSTEQLTTDTATGGEWKIIGDPTEGALLSLAGKAGFEQGTLNEQFERLGEIPFSSERKRMSTIYRVLPGTNLPGEWHQEQNLMFTKGSPEIILERCQGYQDGDRTLPLDNEKRAQILHTNDEMAKRGLRVLGFAYKPINEVPSNEVPSAETSDRAEQDLIWLGLAGMLDAARPEARVAVAKCREAGIRPVMITGDHQLTAQAIAHRLGIAEPDDPVLTGQELERISNLDLETAVEHTNIYARVAPEHKLRIVQALQRRGKFVAMTGDGVNDAPALKQADIGIAMGITGTDVSKEASDMVLLDDNFATIVAATEEGRVVYSNIRRFIKYILGSNVGEVLTIASAPLLGLPGVPLTPLQILWMNLVTDGLPALALAVEPADPNIMRRPPFSPRESIFARGLGAYIVRIGIIFAIISIALMVLAYNWFEGGDAARPGSWRTMVFTTLCIAQMGHALAVRSNQLTINTNFFSNPYLLAAVAVTTILQLLLVYVPFLRTFFGTEYLTPVQLLICLGFSTLMFVWVELEKLFIGWYQRPRR